MIRRTRHMFMVWTLSFKNAHRQRCQAADRIESGTHQYHDKSLGNLHKKGEATTTATCVRSLTKPSIDQSAFQPFPLC